jgi:hypothetical protein
MEKGKAGNYAGLPVLGIFILAEARKIGFYLLLLARDWFFPEDR